jgi:hypothetical protein
MKSRPHSRRHREGVYWLAVFLCSVVAVTAYVVRRGHWTNRELKAMRLEATELTRKIALAENRVQAERDQLQTTDAENQRLIDAIAAGAIPSVANAAKPRLTREEISARYQRGRALEAEGDKAGALAEYFWCYDIGLRPPDLLQRVGRLSETYPPAREGLEERRNRSEARVLSNPDDVETMSDVIALNRALGEDARTMAVYDRLPNSEARRFQGDRSMLEVFLTTQRYADALRVLPYEYLKQGLDRVNQLDEKQSSREKAQQAIIAASGGTEAQRQMQALALQRAREAQRKAAIVESAVGVEILAGAGDLPRALEIARRVLAFDDSTDTRALLEKHAARAGHTELLRGLTP